MQFFDVEGGHSFALADMMPAILEDVLLAEAGQVSHRRGREYAAQGRVTSIRLPDPYLLNAEVQGSARRPYRITIESYDDGMVEFECTCPVGVECKHIYAVLYRIAGAAYCS